MLLLDPIFSPECTASDQRNNPEGDISELANDRPTLGRSGLIGSFRPARTKNSGAFSCRLGSYWSEAYCRRGACGDVRGYVTVVCQIIARTLETVLCTSRRIFSAAGDCQEAGHRWFEL